jgi:hypothetical protein
VLLSGATWPLGLSSLRVSVEGMLCTILLTLLAFKFTLALESQHVNHRGLLLIARGAVTLTSPFMVYFSATMI